MREVYKHEFNTLQKFIAKLTTMWRINGDSIDFRWGYFAPRWGFTLLLNRGGYFDPRYAIDFCLLWGYFSIELPFKTRLGEGCDMPRYGIDLHLEGRTLMLYWGGRFDPEWQQVTMPRLKCWDLPFFSKVFNWHKILINGKWVKYEYELLEKVEKREIKFNYYHGQEIIPVTITWYMEARQWHRKWLPWIKDTRVAYNFSSNEELGKQRGSWKGGTLGFGVETNNGESAIDALEQWLSNERIDYSDVESNHLVEG